MTLAEARQSAGQGTSWLRKRPAQPGRRLTLLAPHGTLLLGLLAFLLAVLGTGQHVLAGVGTGQQVLAAEASISLQQEGARLLSEASPSRESLRSVHTALELGLEAELGQLDALLDALPGPDLATHTTLREQSRARVEQALELNRLRLRVQERMPPQDRLPLTQVTAVGLRQLELEVRLLGLLLRWYPAHRLETLQTEQARLSDWRRADWHSMGAQGWLVGQLVALTVLLLVVRRWNERWFKLLSALILGRTGKRSASLYLDRWLRFLAAVTFDGILLAYLYLAFTVLRQLVQAPGVVLLESLGLAYGWYRLGVMTAHHVLVTAAATTHVEVSAGTSRRILASLRVVGHYFLTVAVLLLFIRHVLGVGTLWVMVAEVAWLGLLPTALRLTQHWRPEIERVYLESGASGRLRQAVELGRGRLAGLPAVMLAGIPVVALGISSWINELALASEQTRSALTYVFRRKLEQHAAANMGEAWSDDLLPNALLEAFSLESSATTPMLDRSPGVEGVARALEAWREGGPGRAVMVVGEWGSGRTSWLRGFWSRAGGKDPDRLVGFSTRLYSEGAVCLELSAMLGLQQCQKITEVVEALRAGPRRLILLDDCHHLLLRSVGGMEGILALVRVIGRTSDHLFWICSMSRYPWLHLFRTILPSDLFSPVVDVDAWDCDDITSLIHQRMMQAGVTASYRDLIVEQMDGVSAGVEVIRTGQRYLRLIWDYSNGNPSVALQCWLRSLAPDGPRRVRVKLFDAPQTDDLEPLSQRSRHVLHALVTHEGLTVGELERVLRFDPQNLEAVLRTLVRAGLIEEGPGARFHTLPHAYSAVLRHLWRKNLLFD